MIYASLYIQLKKVYEFNHEHLSKAFILEKVTQVYIKEMNKVIPRNRLFL